MNTDLNIRQLIDQYLAESDFMPSTLRTYNEVLHYFWRWATTNNIDIRNPQRSDIISWKRHLRIKGNMPSTIDLYTSSLKGFFRWLEQEGIYKNITSNLKSESRERNYKKSILFPDQIKKILTDIDTRTLIGKRDIALITTIYINGLRRIEAQRITLSDINTVESTISIQGKGFNDKTKIPVPKQNMELINQYIQARIDSGEDVKDTSHLFVSYVRYNVFPQPLQPESVSKIIKKRMKDSGFDNDTLTAHSLRHSAAVQLLEKGQTLYDVSIFLRHRSTDTSRLYTRYMEEKKAANKLIRLTLNNDII